MLFRSPRVDAAATTLEAAAEAAGVETLIDDRDETPGVKFADAELMGAPWMATISPRSLDAGGAELTNRATGERSVVALEALMSTIVAARDKERAEIERDLLAAGFPPRLDAAGGAPRS